jgi:hypothetical protein
MNPAETRGALLAFYGAFARRDGAAMAAMYAGNARFEDPVFLLHGADVGKMWRALTGRAKEFSVAYEVDQAAAGRGTVTWTARYRYGSRPVVNLVRSEIVFDGSGLIARQKDDFDFPKWAAQALGPPGALFGRYAWFRRIVSRKAAAGIGVPPKP